MTSSVLTLCQTLGVSPALARVSSCLKCTQLVGDSAQAFDTRSLYNLFSDIEHCVANHQVTYSKMCLKKTVHFNMQDVLGAGQQSQSLEM